MVSDWIWNLEAQFWTNQWNERTSPRTISRVLYRTYEPGAEWSNKAIKFVGFAVSRAGRSFPVTGETLPVTWTLTTSPLVPLCRRVFHPANPFEKSPFGRPGPHVIAHWHNEHGQYFLSPWAVQEALHQASVAIVFGTATNSFALHWRGDAHCVSVNMSWFSHAQWVEGQWKGGWLHEAWHKKVLSGSVLYRLSAQMVLPGLTLSEE